MDTPYWMFRVSIGCLLNTANKSIVFLGIVNHYTLFWCLSTIVKKTYIQCLPIRRCKNRQHGIYHISLLGKVPPRNPEIHRNCYLKEQWIRHKRFKQSIDFRIICLLIYLDTPYFQSIFFSCFFKRHRVLFCF